MRAVVLGRGLQLVPADAAALLKALPRSGNLALWAVEVDGQSRILPVSRKGVRVTRAGGAVLVEPTGLFELAWRIELGQGKGLDDLIKALADPATAKRLREWGAVGVYGPGGSLPQLRRLSWGGLRTQWGPVLRFRKEHRAATGANPAVAEVGMTVDMAARLARAAGIQLDDRPEAAKRLVKAAWQGQVLLILRRNPLTDSKTGFIVAMPVLVDPGKAFGDMLWLPADVPGMLYGDEDGDRYFVDLVAVNRSRIKHVTGDGVVIHSLTLEAAAGQFAADQTDRAWNIKPSGLRGAAAQAGVLAAAGVGALFSLTFRLAGALAHHNLEAAALEVSSRLLRVLEPLFDARKRLFNPGSVTVFGETVPAYQLPYIRQLVLALRAKTVGEVAVVLGDLAAQLQADQDPDARATGQLVAEAVEFLRPVPQDMPLQLDGGDDGNVFVSDVELAAWGTAMVPLTGDLYDKTDRPVLSRRRNKGGGAADQSTAWCRLDQRARNHLLALVAMGVNRGLLPLGGALGDDRVAAALSSVAKILPASVLLPVKQVPPTNQQAAEAYLSRPVPVVLTEEDLQTWEQRAGMKLSDSLGNDLTPVFVEPGEELLIEVVDETTGEKQWRSVAQIGKVHSSAFRVALGLVRRDGRAWYRWHLLMQVAAKQRGQTWDGKPFVRLAYAWVSIAVTPWFDADPDEVVSGCSILGHFGDREEWLPARAEVVVRNVRVDSGNLEFRLDFGVMPPQRALLAAMLGGLLMHQLGALGKPSKTMEQAVQHALGVGAQSQYALGTDEAVRIQRAVRQTVRQLAATALPIRDELALLTAKHVLVYGDLVKSAMLFAAVPGIPAGAADWALARFDEAIQGFIRRVFGAGAAWWPRKGGQNRVIVMDVTSAAHWRELLAPAAQEWYRFLRETPGLKAALASVAGKEAVVHRLRVALVIGKGVIQPTDGKSSSETAFLSSHRIEWVEQERSVLVELPEGADHAALIRTQLRRYLAHGFEYVRGVDGGLVRIDKILEGDLDVANLPFAHRWYEASITATEIQRSVQFWAVARVLPVGAKVILLDGMIKSFASMIHDKWVDASGKPVDAIFSLISLEKKQAWGLLLNGEMRKLGLTDAEIERVWDLYRSHIHKNASLWADPATAGQVEAEAWGLVFDEVRKRGGQFQQEELFIEKDGQRISLGKGYIVEVDAVFVDDTAVRDDDPDEAGINGTTLFAAELAGLRYDQSFVDASRAVAESQAAWYLLRKLSGDPNAGEGIPVIDLPSQGDDDGGPDGGGDGDGGGVPPSGGDSPTGGAGGSGAQVLVESLVSILGQDRASGAGGASGAEGGE